MQSFKKKKKKAEINKIYELHISAFNHVESHKHHKCFILNVLFVFTKTTQHATDAVNKLLSLQQAFECVCF